MERFFMGKIFWRHPGHLIWIAVAYLPFLWAFAIPMTGDQKTYIAIAMEMREKGEWLIPSLFGEPNFLKPPLQYWATLVGWKIFGFNLLGTFLPSVLTLGAAAYFLNEIASLLGERRWYVSAGLWFAASVGALTFGTSAQMEIYLCLFFSASWWSALRYLSVPDAEREPKYLYIAFLIAGACAWVKSPLYSVLWTMGFVSYLLISGEWLMLKSKHLYGAFVAGCALGCAWFVAAAAIEGEAFWRVYWTQEQAGKISGNRGKIWNLWLPLLYFCAPFTLLIFTAVRSIFLGRRTAAILRFVICWSWPSALFFTLYPYRTSIYLFILVPALAVLVDWGCFRANRRKTFLWLSRITAVLFPLALGFAGYLLQRAEVVPYWLALALAAAGVAAGASLWFGGVRSFLIASLFSILFFRMASVEIMKPTMNGLRAIIPEEKGVRMGMLDESRNIWHEIGLIAVTLKRPLERLYGLDDLLEILQAGGTVILSDEEYEKYGLTLESWLRERGRSVETMPWRRFKRGGRLPVRQILIEGRGAIPEESMVREFKVVRAAKLE